MAILISFDIDGTLEVGDPPGPLTMDMVRIVQEKGFLIGSCSDRPPTSQRSLWEEYDIHVDFTVAKHLLAGVKSDFEADAYYHIGDREDLDPDGRMGSASGSIYPCGRMALRVGLISILWPDEAAEKSWFEPDA